MSTKKAKTNKIPLLYTDTTALDCDNAVIDQRFINRRAVRQLAATIRDLAETVAQLADVIVSCVEIHKEMAKMVDNIADII